MTCEEYRKSLGQDISTTTRGQRASVLVHFDTCGSCRAWFFGTALSMLAREHPLKLLEDFKAIEAVLNEDEQDPEFMGVVGRSEKSRLCEKRHSC